MMKAFVLPGYACTSWIWNRVRGELDPMLEITWVDWPRDRTPGWHSVVDFANWLEPQSREADVVVGHSMGGLVALELARRQPALRRVVLVETFLRPPGAFFQNLLMASAGEALACDVRTMLDQEKAFYAPVLRESLRSEAATAPPVAFTALYGDRGCGAEQVVRALDWTEELRKSGRVKVIAGACHFPMLENPRDTIRALREAVLGE